MKGIAKHKKANFTALGAGGRRFNSCYPDGVEGSLAALPAPFFVFRKWKLYKSLLIIFLPKYYIIENFILLDIIILVNTSKNTQKRSLELPKCYQDLRTHPVNFNLL